MRAIALVLYDSGPLFEVGEGVPRTNRDCLKQIIGEMLLQHFHFDISGQHCQTEIGDGNRHNRDGTVLQQISPPSPKTHRQLYRSAFGSAGLAASDWRRASVAA
jgi:hypothetical protein